ncbi:MAG: DEAD/DEAH box helicase, partial [Proteobacteria bacterium]|nr:DEAD/DEAH box helicase [Pseudomonadota bacterium]
MIDISFDSKKRLGIVSGDLFNEIREHFSVKNESAVFMRKYGRFLPQRTYAITPTGRFEPGLFLEIKKFLTTNQYSQELKVHKEFLDEILPAKSRWKLDPKFNLNEFNLSLPLRDYQKEIVDKALGIGRGTIVLATAGGKTLTAASLISKFFELNNALKCLYIVPDLGLVEQTNKDFMSYNVPFTCCKWTGTNPIDLNIISNVTIANLGILQSKNSDLSWIENIDVLVVDEVHKLRKGNEINKILKRIKTPVRFGFTGTMPEDLLDQWNIIGKIGPIIYEKSSYQLRLESFVSNATALVCKLHYKNKPKYPETNYDATDKYRAEIDFLINNTFRNNFIAKITSKINKNILILVDYIEHGTLLEQTLKTTLTSKRIYFIRGEVEIQEREKIRNLMEESDDIIVVAISKIFSTGINIKNLHYIVFAGGGKAKIKILQSIGRGLRLHKDKTKLIIIDI